MQQVEHCEGQTENAAFMFHLVKLLEGWLNLVAAASAPLPSGPCRLVDMHGFAGKGHAQHTMCYWASSLGIRAG